MDWEWKKMATKIGSLTHTRNKNGKSNMGFVQAGLDVQTSTVCIAVLWFEAGRILLGF
jgi:hypothetical protein